MKIANHELGYSHPTFIIAEACSNITRYLDGKHSLEYCVEFVADTGADAIKLQLFTHAHFPEAEWESKKRVEFPRTRLEEFSTLCREHRILWGASVFDDEAVDLCVELGADFIKLATREWNNSLLLNKCFQFDLPLIRSYDWTQGVFRSMNNYVMMACVPRYPAWNFILPSQFQIDGNDLMPLWGWSSHTVGYTDCLIAVSRYASVIEKHIAFSPQDYEAGHSLSLGDFSKMVKDIRDAERMR